MISKYLLNEWASVTSLWKIKFLEICISPLWVPRGWEQAWFVLQLWYLALLLKHCREWTLKRGQGTGEHEMGFPHTRPFAALQPRKTSLNFTYSRRSFLSPSPASVSSSQLLQAFMAVPFLWHLLPPVFLCLSHEFLKKRSCLLFPLISFLLNNSLHRISALYRFIEGWWEPEFVSKKIFINSFPGRLWKIG